MDEFFLGQFSPEKPIFNGISTGKPRLAHDLHGNIYGFCLRFSQENQSIDLTKILVCNWITRYHKETTTSTEFMERRWLISEFFVCVTPQNWCLSGVIHSTWDMLWD